MPQDPRELLTRNLALIKRAVGKACWAYRFNEANAEELASIVNEKLVEDDYAVLRKFEERSQFSTWIHVVVARIALDVRIAAWGKWYASAEAKRLGPAAVDLEQLIHRDGQPLEGAFTIVMANHPITREALQAIADRLPAREPRLRQVELQEATLVAKPMPVDDALLEKHRQRVAEHLSTILSEAIRDLPDDDRLILQLRFQGGMSVAQIARSLQVNQKPLYRRIEQLLHGMKGVLLGNGLDPGDVVDLVGRDSAILEFGLRNYEPHPSNRPDEGATATTEDSQ